MYSARETSLWIKRLPNAINVDVNEERKTNWHFIGLILSVTADRSHDDRTLKITHKHLYMRNAISLHVCLIDQGGCVPCVGEWNPLWKMLLHLWCFGALAKTEIQHCIRMFLATKPGCLWEEVVIWPEDEPLYKIKITCDQNHKPRKVQELEMFLHGSILQDRSPWQINHFEGVPISYKLLAVFHFIYLLWLACQYFWHKRVGDKSHYYLFENKAAQHPHKKMYELKDAHFARSAVKQFSWRFLTSTVFIVTAGLYGDPISRENRFL